MAVTLSQGQFLPCNSQIECITAGSPCMVVDTKGNVSAVPSSFCLTRPNCMSASCYCLATSYITNPFNYSSCGLCLDPLLVLGVAVEQCASTADSNLSIDYTLSTAVTNVTTVVSYVCECICPVVFNIYPITTIIYLSTLGITSLLYHYC